MRRHCTHCGKRITFDAPQWADATTGTDCPNSTVGHKPAVRERKPVGADTIEDYHEAWFNCDVEFDDFHTGVIYVRGV